MALGQIIVLSFQRVIETYGADNLTKKKVKGIRVHSDVRLDRITKKFVNTIDDLGFKDANHKLNQLLQYRHSKGT